MERKKSISIYLSSITYHLSSIDLQRGGKLLFVSRLQLSSSLDGTNTDYNDIHNWSLYEKPGLLKADITSAHSENSRFH